MADYSRLDYQQNVIFPSIFISTIKSIFPFFKVYFNSILFIYYQWMSTYEISYIIHDLIAGVTVAAVILPQSMAYAMLAGLPPVVGLYSSIFPILIYFFMGTSKHLSVGPFALTSLLVNNSIAQLLPKTLDDTDRASIFLIAATVITFVAGCYKVIVGITRLGAVLVKLMAASEAFMSAFIFSSAIMIITSVLGQILGIGALPNSSGMLLLLNQYLYLIENTSSIKIPELLLCIISSVIILLFRKFNEVYYPKVKLPDFLFLLVITTFIVWSCDLHNRFNIAIVGSIPSGLPNFTLIDWNYGNILSKMNSDPYTFTKSLCISAITLSLISIFITLAIVIKFAIQFDYLPEIDYNQEIIALGASSCVSYFVPCYASCGSLSRSVILAEAGAKSLYATLLQVLVVVIVLLCASGILKYVSTCVLATIIIIAFSKIIFDVKDCIKFWKRDKLEFSVWLCTCMSIFVFNLDKGFYISFLWSITVALYRYLNPLWALLGVNKFEHPEYFDQDFGFDFSKILHKFFSRATFAQLSHRSSNSINRPIIKIIGNDSDELDNITSFETPDDEFVKPLNIFTGVIEIKKIKIFKLYLPITLEISSNLRQLFINLCCDNPKTKDFDLVSEFNNLVIDTSNWGTGLNEEIMVNVNLFVQPFKNCGVTIYFVAQGRLLLQFLFYFQVIFKIFLLTQVITQYS